MRELMYPSASRLSTFPMTPRPTLNTIPFDLPTIHCLTQSLLMVLTHSAKTV